MFAISIECLRQNTKKKKTLPNINKLLKRGYELKSEWEEIE